MACNCLDNVMSVTKEIREREIKETARRLTQFYSKQKKKGFYYNFNDLAKKKKKEKLFYHNFN